MTRSFLDSFYSFIAFIQGCIQEFVQGGGQCIDAFLSRGALHPLGFHWSRGLAPIAPPPLNTPLPLSSIRVKILRYIRKTNGQNKQYLFLHQEIFGNKQIQAKKSTYCTSLRYKRNLLYARDQHIYRLMVSEGTRTIFCT